MYNSGQHCIVQYSTVQYYSTAQYSTVQIHVVHTCTCTYIYNIIYEIIISTCMYNSGQHCIVQYSTVQYYSTAQYSTVQIHVVHTCTCTYIYNIIYEIIISTCMYNSGQHCIVQYSTEQYYSTAQYSTVQIHVVHTCTCAQGCGNIELTTRHFGLFSPLLSCFPYTLYTV